MTRSDAVLTAKQMDRQISTSVELLPDCRAQITIFSVRPVIEALCDSCGYEFREIKIENNSYLIFSATKRSPNVNVCVQGSEPING